MSAAAQPAPVPITTARKLVLLGESAVGKSSIVLQFVKKQFDEWRESTIGASGDLLLCGDSLADLAWVCRCRVPDADRPGQVRQLCQVRGAFRVLARSYRYSPSLRAQIWDTAGQERYKSLAPMYYRSAHAAIVAFDITSSVSGPLHLPQLYRQHFARPCFR